jgi:tetratricopeptide (TPR) repeat protein
MELKVVQKPIHEVKYLMKQAQEKAMAGDHVSALENLNKAIHMDPKYAEAYVLLGNCQECIEKHEDAITSYNKAIEIDPYHADAWFNKAMSLKKLGKTQEATQCIDKSIDLHFGR